MMDNRALGKLFFVELRKCMDHGAMQPSQRLLALHHILVLLFQEFSHRKKLSFSSLYARMAYVCQQQQLSKPLQYALHHFRKNAQEQLGQATLSDPSLLELGYRVLADAIAELFDCPIPPSLQSRLPSVSIYPKRTTRAISFRPQVRGVVISDDAVTKCLQVLTEDQPTEIQQVRYDVADRNDHFNQSILLLRDVIGFPLTVNLIDVEIDDQGVLSPRGFVWEPDFLIDVSAIAECFKPDGIRTQGYLMRKFLPYKAKPPLMLGNIANFFLDELMSDVHQDFRSLIERSFQLNPLAFSLYDDRTVMQIVKDAKTHYAVLKNMVLQGLAQEGIEPEKCNLEPSFYSQKYGLQGRLDLLYRKAEECSIVELKSGKVFMPNAYGINRSHYIQTLLYDLMIRASYGKQVDPKNYILYSQDAEKPLRYAPKVSAKQMDALAARNQLIAMEYQLAALGDSYRQLPALFRKLRGLPLRGFLKKDVDAFIETLDGASPLSQAYFTAFTGFVAREHRLAKLGSEHGQGQSALWLLPLADKQDQFAILHKMQMVKDESDKDTPKLHFRKNMADHTVAKFRKGDLCVLYPSQERSLYSSPLSDQVFKCSVEDIRGDDITLLLRARQFNHALFENTAFWNLESDMYDGSFYSQYQQLYAFLKAPHSKQDLWLTKIPPRQPTVREVAEAPANMTAEQAKLYHRIIAMQDYFLLWGPPGTGKTSVMLKQVTNHLYHHTLENVLLLAYTNRAVDEICAAIESVHSSLSIPYIRIGSHLGCSSKYHPKLLQEQTKGLTKRKELRRFLDRHRIYVATVSSIQNKQELFEIKQFDRVIIDEASQLLEPMLVGMLTRFDKVLLIGDHRQLPAVVAQEVNTTNIAHPGLRALGLEDMRESLFERLYRRAQANGWHWAYGRLSQQGRMHEDIMEFANLHFYSGFLKILPEHIPHSQYQQSAWLKDRFACDGIQGRVCFVPVYSDASTSVATKVSDEEADAVCQWSEMLLEHVQGHFHSHTLGIITPYRAQIVHIQEKMRERGLPVDQISVDTVERYQGSAREVIFISLCTNHSWQLERLVSISSEGIDRKFNVAMTRAKRLLVVFGNPTLLQDQAVYRDFVDRYSIE